MYKNCTWFTDLLQDLAIYLPLPAVNWGGSWLLSPPLFYTPDNFILVVMHQYADVPINQYCFSYIALPIADPISM